MGKIRALIVDDSVVVRRILREVLDEDPEIEVTATAPNGKIGLAQVDQLTPDVVILDMEMPVMGGLEALAAIRERHPLLPVVMFSAQTERGAVATLDALAAGANDYVPKPTATARLEDSLDSIRETLIPKIKALCGTAHVPLRHEPVVRQKTKRKQPLSPSRVDVVAIGVSTGGPVALTKVLPQLPGNLRAPLVIVQHMPPLFTRHLATRLDAICELEVSEGTNGAQLLPGTAWIAPGDSHMEVETVGGSLQLRMHKDPPENSCRPAADPLFRSVAVHCGSHALAVVLTGMGSDGLRGCETVHERGGRIVVQDEASSVVWGMPGFVAKADLADTILPVDRIASEITRLVESRGVAARPRALLRED